jgi:hypothetical protein
LIREIFLVDISTKFGNIAIAKVPKYGLFSTFARGRSFCKDINKDTSLIIIDTSLINDTSLIIIPLNKLCVKWLVKILSISVAECAVMRVGILIKGKNIWENRFSTNSLVAECAFKQYISML